MKARLSEYVRMAKAGEIVLITDRDEVVAEIRASRRQPIESENFEDKMDQLADAGLLTKASKRPKDWKGFQTNISVPLVETEKILDDLRKDKY